MERSRRRPKPVVVMYAGCGWSHLIPFLHFAKILCLDHGFPIVFITHEKFIPGKKEYIERVASSCNVTMKVAQATDGAKIASHLKLLHDRRFPICAYVVDSMWTKSPQLASYHLNMASEMGIHTYIFFHHSASFLCLALLKEKLHQGVRVRRIPGLYSVHATDVPAPLLAKEFLAEQIPRASALSGMQGIIINSWDRLEDRQIHALRADKALPPIYPIGPLLPSRQMLAESDQEPAAWATVEFLNCRKEKSVVFVSLGPVVLSAEQIRELAVGLEACGHPFLWALKAGAKPPFSILQSLLGEAQSYSLSELLPEGFENRTKDRGMIISCPPPQGYILSHPSIGAFVSHCGWNSTLQSIVQGVPIIAWPVFDNEQKLNALVLLRKMKAAIEVKKGADGLVNSKEVERCARAIMGTGSEGSIISSKMFVSSIHASTATRMGGSSHQAIISLTTAFNSKPK